MEDTGNDERGQEAASAVGAAELCGFDYFLGFFGDIGQVDADNGQARGGVGLFQGRCNLGAVAEGDMHFFGLFHCFFFGEDHEFLAVIGYDQACILAHHGEYEYGSPKKPAIIEAAALNLADNTDAKMETFMEALQNAKDDGWLGYNRLFESNIRMTRME